MQVKQLIKAGTVVITRQGRTCVRDRVTQYSETPEVNIDVAEYWIIRLRG